MCYIIWLKHLLHITLLIEHHGCLYVFILALYHAHFLPNGFWQTFLIFFFNFITECEIVFLFFLSPYFFFVSFLLSHKDTTEKGRENICLKQVPDNRYSLFFVCWSICFFVSKYSITYSEICNSFFVVDTVLQHSGP